MMKKQRLSAWVVPSISLLILCGFALLPGASVRPALARPPRDPLPPLEVDMAAAQVTSDLGDPTSIVMDEDGYTVWTYDYPAADDTTYHPFGAFRWPFDLGTQDTSALSNVTLRLTYFQDGYGPPPYEDVMWGVSLNSKSDEPKNIVGVIVSNPASHGVRPEVEDIPLIEWYGLRDGENTIDFEPYNYCPELPLGQCTIGGPLKLELRALAELAVKEVWPKPDAENVWPEQHLDSEIRVQFTTLVSETTVNENTFTLSYRDEDLNEVPVPGTVEKLSETEFRFVPDADLLPGIRYRARIWGEDEAYEEGYDHWVQDLVGGPLVTGRTWFFWTMPDLQVTVKPVQILENVTLIANRPTVVRTFIRWDRQEGVHERTQVPTVEVDDITLVWVNTGGGAGDGITTWRHGTPWKPAYGPNSAIRKREYRIFTSAEESYDTREKYDALDSVNYYGFAPPEAGQYTLMARVIVNDNQGRARPFTGRATVLAKTAQNISIPMRAVAVGDDHGKTGTVDLSATINNNVRGMRAIYPTSYLAGPPAPGHMAYYSPTTTLWWGDWSVEPGTNSLKKYLLQEMSALCERTTRCDAMVGLAPSDWLVDNGLTTYWTSSAPFGALVKNDSSSFANRYLVAHEVGHLRGFEHDEIRGGEGFDVRRRQDMRYSVDGDTVDFMTENPISSAARQLWIGMSRYINLAEWTGVTPWSLAHVAPSVSDETSSDPLLLVSGAITESTSETQLLPWYQMEPGEWQPSEEDGPYSLVFLDDVNKVIEGYTRPFAAGGGLRYAAQQDAGTVEASAADDPAIFTFVTPYPAAAARAQIRRIADSAVLAEVVAGTAPRVSINDPATTWTGAQSLTWQPGGSAQYFAVDVSTDGGESWEALAIHLTGNSATLQTATLPNTTEAYVRVAATNGFRTATDTAGPFTIDNPPLVAYTDPSDDAIDVGIHELVYAGFRDPMNAATLNADTFTLSGPSGRVPGTVTYDSETREVTFEPATPLTYSTTYTARLTTGVRDATGERLPAATTWTFTTEGDPMPPRPRVLSPRNGATQVPRTAVLAVLWDEALAASTIDAATFTLADAKTGAPVSGAVAYDEAARTATFTPSAPLAPDTDYVATLKAGVADAAGNATTGDYRWPFTTGADEAAGLRFTSAFGDRGRDDDSDGLYEQLLIQVGVHVPAAGDYTLNGLLVDADGGAITSAHVDATLTAGVHLLELAFDGPAIGGRGVDGPYTLASIALVQRNDEGGVVATAARINAYRTFAYSASSFPSPLHFGPLPDVQILPDTEAFDAFNVRDYAEHASLPSDVLTYTLVRNADPRIGVEVLSAGAVRLTPDSLAFYSGVNTEVTLRAGDGTHTVQATFEVNVGWPVALYLPVTLRGYDTAVAAAGSSAWITLIEDDFEESTFGWSRSSSIDTTHQPEAWYHWDRRDCRAYSGQYSAWAFGGGDDGTRLMCGANYPQAIYTLMYQGTPVNLKYVAQGEYSAKVWTNLNPGDEVCLRVAATNSDSCSSEYGWPIISASDPGVCRSGQTNDWEDLTLDMADVPQVGSVLSEERVCLGVTFQSQYGETRPEGAYVDDVNLRICPEGLTEYCGGEPTTPPAPPLTAGNVGGYPEDVDEAALAVGKDGRVHALWTGQLNPSFQKFVFYSSSPDGVTWTPYQILSYRGGREPRIAVDNVHGRVHLAYGNDEGVVHRTVADGVVSDPVVVAAQGHYYLPGQRSPSGGVAWPSLAVADETGVAHLLWREHYYVKYDATYYSRYRTWYAYWDEAAADGGGWSAPLRKISARDTEFSSIAAAPDGRAMMAWFPDWGQSLGDETTAGDPIVARTAYGEAPGSFPLRQATHDLYPEPERDESIFLAYAGGADAFVLASDHFMWPGFDPHSRAYRYVWQDGAWTGPLSIAGNTSGRAYPIHVGAAADSPLIRYVYRDDGVRMTRTETNSVLGSAQTVDAYLNLSGRGYESSPKAYAYFTDARGDLHMIISGEKNGVAGFYYVKP